MVNENQRVPVGMMLNERGRLIHTNRLNHEEYDPIW
jgi:hypothetical protein